MKHKRLAILACLALFISVFTFFIYRNTYTEEINYVALGDSVAAGRNPYGVEDYGYTDYVRDYLKKHNKLKNYVSYAVSGYKSQDVIDDINHNKNIEVDGKVIGIKKALRESDLVTISIGANDFLNGMSLSSISSILSDDSFAIKQIDNTITKIEQLLKVVKQYAKGDIVVVGYYNPLPNLTKYKSQINEIVDYADVKYEKLCQNEGIHYVEISSIMSTNSEYLPNPLDIHPSKQGYKVISNEVIKTLEKKVFQ